MPNGRSRARLWKALSNRTRDWLRGLAPTSQCVSSNRSIPSSSPRVATATPKGSSRSLRPMTSTRSCSRRGALWPKQRLRSMERDNLSARCRYGTSTGALEPKRSMRHTRDAPEISSVCFLARHDHNARRPCRTPSVSKPPANTTRPTGEMPGSCWATKLSSPDAVSAGATNGPSASGAGSTPRSSRGSASRADRSRPRIATKWARPRGSVP